MNTFKIGGVHPHDNKQYSVHLPITECPLPQEAIIPLVQHIGAPAQAVVEVGAKVKVGELIAKAGGFVSANICSPVSGTVVEVNEALNDNPELVNSDPYENWIIKVQLSDASETANLMGADAYKTFINE